MGDLRPFRLLGKPTPDNCPVCAATHDPEQPHDQRSLYYQYYFYNQHGRFPTWADAMEHCPEDIRQFWTAELNKCGIEV